MLAAEVIFSDGTVVKNCDFCESEIIEGFLDITFPNGKRAVVNKTDITCIYLADIIPNEY